MLGRSARQMVELSATSLFVVWEARADRVRQVRYAKRQAQPVRSLAVYFRLAVRNTRDAALRGPELAVR